MALQRYRREIDNSFELASWNAPQPRSFVPSLRLVTVASAVLGLCTLLAVMVAPYRIAKPHILLLLPAATTTGDPSIELARQSVGLNRNADQARVTFSSLEMIAGLVESNSSVFGTSPASLASVLRKSETGHAPLIVYASGVLRVTPQGCLLCESLPLAQKEQGLKISTLLTQVSQADNAANIVCIEAWSDPNSLSTKLAPGLEIIQCREEIENHLKTNSDQPMAVIVSQANEMAEPDYGSMINGALLHDLAEGMERLSSQSSELLSSHDFIEAVLQVVPERGSWLVNNAWRSRSIPIHLPRVELAKDVTPSGPADHQLNAPASGSPSSSEVAPGMSADHASHSLARRAETRADTSAVQLEQVHQLTQLSTSENMGRAIIASWKTDGNTTESAIDGGSSTNLDWARYYLEDESLSWKLRQDLLRNKLLSLRLLSICPVPIDQFAALELAEKLRLSADRNAVTQFGRDWQARSAVQTAAAYQQLQDCERYLNVRTSAAALAVEFSRELPHWDSVLIPSEDRQTNLDGVCRGVELLTELNRLITRNDIELTNDLERLTRELTELRQSWLALKENPQPTTTQPTHARLWMRAQRQTSILRYLSEMCHERAESAPSQFTQTELWNTLSRLQALSQSTHTTTSELLGALRPLDQTRTEWLERLPTDFGSFAEQGEQAACAISLQASLAIDLPVVEQRTETLHNAQTILKVRTQAEHAIRQLAVCDQHAAKILQRELVKWNQLLTELRQPPVLDPLAGLTLQIADELDLSLSGEQQIRFRIINNSPHAHQACIQVESDTEIITCRLLPSDFLDNGEFLKQPTSLVSTQSRSADHSQTTRFLPPNSTFEKQLRVERKEFVSDHTNVSLHLSCSLGERHHILRAKLENQAMVSLRMVNRSSLPTVNELIAEDVLFANRIGRIACELTNEREQPMQVAVQVWAAEKPTDDLPRGALKTSAIESWLATQSTCVLVESSPPAWLQPGQGLALRLPPLKLDPTALKQVANQLLLVVTATGTDQSQILAWQPRTVRPAAYIRPRISYDAHRSELKLKLDVNEEASLPSEGIRVVARLSDLNDLNSGNQAALELTREHGNGELLMKAQSSESPLRLLRVDVDGWPNAFVYRIDTRRSQDTIALADEIQAIHVAESTGRQVLSNSDNFVAVEVEAIVSDGHFLPEREIVSVGLDFNRDRTLWNEPAARLFSPVESSILWNGCDADGNLLLESVVQKPVLRLPVASSFNGHAAILASVEHHGATVWSNSQPLIIDHQPPRIVYAAPTGTQTPLLGKPIEVRVLVDDGDLSGVAAVQGAWSLSGSTELSANISVVEAVKLQADTWSLLLPTEALRSGSTLLLVRAVDKAGNVSDTHREFIEVLDEDAVLRKQQSITTHMRGRVLFATQPLAGLKLELTTEADKSKQWQATTSTAGEFFFDAVPSGSYQVAVGGMVRGMRITRRAAVQIDATQQPAPIVFRLDRPEASPTQEQR